MVVRIAKRSARRASRRVQDIDGCSKCVAWLNAKGDCLRVSCSLNFAEVKSEGWRRGRDSNPWKPFDFNGFQDRRLKPLGHLSVT